MLAYLKFLYDSFEKMLFQMTDDEEEYDSGDVETDDEEEYDSGDVETDDEDITNVGVCDSDQTTIVDTDSDSEMEMEVSSRETEIEPEDEDENIHVRNLIVHNECLGEEFIKPMSENLSKMYNRPLAQRKIIYGDDGETMWYEEDPIIENSPNNSDNTDDNLNNNSAVSNNVFESNAVYNDNELRKRNTQIIDSMV